MKFFIPLSTNDQQMERIYQKIVQRLIKMGYGPFHERTYQIKFRRDNQEIVDTVGEMCPISLETVLAILKNDRGFLIVSYSRGAVGGEPIVINYQIVESVTLFDE
jgi:hypothetical protein